MSSARYAEQFGFDAVGLGERHAGAFLSSDVTVLLGAIAATTSRVRIQTGVSVLSIHAPLRVAEDYATVDQLSRGRLELVIGKGNEMRQLPMFGIENGDQWDAMAEKYELLRRLWREEMGHLGGPLPRTAERGHQPAAPLRRRPSGMARVGDHADLGDPLFSANAIQPRDQYTVLIDHRDSRRTDVREIHGLSSPGAPDQGDGHSPRPSVTIRQHARSPAVVGLLARWLGRPQPRPRATTRLHVPRARGARADRAPHGPCAIRLLSQSRILRSRWRWPGCRTAQE
ncbi:LLM class flavin-dependent oxidoreductase [Streptomyces sp. NPDC056704]|uniref:LLM class flavin-dependent oxidoreductase n=1 Tax=Streptomyces sp. NPDC056704 TaxID=3345917 RepID=UPI0036980F96